jgi:hypothetical protein
LRDTGSVAAAQTAVYDHTCWLIHAYFCLTGTRDYIAGKPLGAA